MNQKEMNKQNEFMLAYEPIHNRFERFCRARAYGFMDQEDLMSETICRAYHSWNKIKDKNNFLYFLFGTANNILKNQYRKKKETEPHRYHPTVVNNGELNLEVEFLYTQLNKLSEYKKEAIILFEISGFSIKEIAQIQKTTSGAVNMRLKRARQELKHLLIDEPVEANLKLKSHE